MKICFRDFTMILNGIGFIVDDLVCFVVGFIGKVCELKSWR